MARHTTANGILQDVSNGLQSTMERHDTDAVVCVKRQTANIINPFVILFYENLENVIDNFNLSIVDVKVLLKIMKRMQYGNLLNMPFAQIAKEVGIAKPNIYRTKKRLFESQVLIEVDGAIYVNPNVIAKGNFAETKNNKDNIDLLNETYDKIENSNISPSILTKNIREKQKSKKMKDDIKEEVQQMTEDIMQNVINNNPITKKSK